MGQFDQAAAIATVGVYLLNNATGQKCKINRTIPYLFKRKVVFSSNVAWFHSHTAGSFLAHLHLEIKPEHRDTFLLHPWWGQPPQTRGFVLEKVVVLLLLPQHQAPYRPQSLPRSHTLYPPRNLPHHHFQSLSLDSNLAADNMCNNMGQLSRERSLPPMNTSEPFLSVGGKKETHV
ncbi:UNVERIFIED_CONTAM: hypothetical protein K2H54_041843 [Gekko kuhli]